MSSQSEMVDSITRAIEKSYEQLRTVGDNTPMAVMLGKDIKELQAKRMYYIGDV